MKLSARKSERGKQIELSMTSMIDVVFLLLIFFLVTTTFVKPEKQMLSAIRVDNDGDRSSQELEPAIVDIDRANEQTVYRLGRNSTADQSVIAELLSNFQNKSSGVFVRVGSTVPFGDVAQLISLCKQAGFEQVNYVPGQTP